MIPATNVIPLRKTDEGWFVAEIRGAEHIPEYDPREVGRGLSDSAFKREILGDWSASTGRVVFPEFGPIHLAKDPLPFDPRRPLLCGWDQGGMPSGGTPAFVPTQLNAYGQWLIYKPVMPDEDETVGIYDFCQWVAEYLQERFAEPFGLTLKDLNLIHYGDPAGNAPPPKTLGMMSAKMEHRSCYEIIRRGQQVIVGTDAMGEPIIDEKPGFGWYIRPGEVSLTKRLEAIRARLTSLHEGLPMLVVDTDATIIRDAFQGAYHYKQRNDGRYELDPYKNHASNCVDALSYAASRMAAVLPEDPDDRMGAWGGRGSVTRSPGRRR